MIHPTHTPPSPDASPAPPPAPESPTQIAPASPLTLRDRWALFPSNLALAGSLTALMALAAFFRFWRISVQCYWTDESYTVNRIKGTFPQMLASLSDQGFPPGWYAMLRWWTMAAEYFTGSGYTALTSPVTRSLTAIFGTLTVPAMYFLGRQFTDRKGALLVALLTAVNPYLIYYSRDIKMYQPLWFFLILNIAIFFKWQTTRKHLVWFPLFVATGFLMTAMHSTAWFMVGLQLIFLVTRPKIKPLDAPLWVAGVGVMSLLPIYWYLDKTNWFDRVIERGGDANLTWVANYTGMSWSTIASLPCSHLLGYLYPSFPPDGFVRRWFNLGRDFDEHIGTRSWPWMASMQFWVAVGFAAILLLGLIPWRGFRRSDERRGSVTRYRFWWIAVWLIVPPACLALTWIPVDSVWHGWVWHTWKPRPIWEPRYLGVIIPPLVLWLAASLRRLPTWPVRGVAVAFVLGASVFSALSNHLILRNPPFHKAAEIAMEYYDPANKGTLAVGHVELTTPGKVIPLTYDLARKIRPLDPATVFLTGENFEVGLWGSKGAVDWLRAMRLRPEVETIVLTDRQGDVTEAKDMLSDESLGERLGPRWKMVRKDRYVLHYEWRFYVFNTWRTRVWRRQELPETGGTTAPGG